MTTRAVRLLARPEVGIGFALAGLRPSDVESAREGETRLRELLEESDVGVVLLEDAAYHALPEELRRRLGRRSLPMIVPFPGPAWAARAEEAEAYIVELLRQVIGYRVRLR
jgi:vacuolar-type H+-ATPase subunit F/Vma7